MNYWAVQTKRNAILADGVSVRVPGFEEWEFFVRPDNAWNVHYTRAVARIAAARPEILDYIGRVGMPGYIETDEDRDLSAYMETHGLAEGLLAGWRGVTGEDGEPLEFSPANAVRVLEFFPAIRKRLSDASRDIALFPVLTSDDKADITAGNSPAGCDLSSDHGAITSARSQPAGTRGAKARREK